MKLWIICSGKTAAASSGSFDSAGFDALCAQERELGLMPGTSEKSAASNGRRIYVGGSQADLETARLIFPDGDIARETLLDPIPRRSFKDTVKKLPLWLWRLMAWLQWRFGSKRQPESRKAAILRAEELIGRLEAEDADCVLVCHPSFAAVLLDRLRLHSCCISRGGIARYMPMERILVTARSMHCGGCSHNCLLTNPGCGVGRDKAARKSG